MSHTPLFTPQGKNKNSGSITPTRMVIRVKNASVFGIFARLETALVTHYNKSFGEFKFVCADPWTPVKLKSKGRLRRDGRHMVSLDLV